MDWLLRNFWLKVVAFGLAFLVWVYVATEKTYTWEFLLPLSEVTLGEGLALTVSPPDSLLVNVSGTGKQLLRRQWRQNGIRVNAGQYPAGRFTLNFTGQNSSLVHSTAEISLNEVVAPTSMRLEIDTEAKVELPIKPEVETTADEGFAVLPNLSIEPATATLIGPRSKLQMIESIHTERRLLGSLRNSITVKLGLMTPEGYGFRVEPESVLVTVPVFPIKTRVFENVPIMTFNLPAGQTPRLRPNRVMLEVTGPPDEVDLLDRNALTVSVDYREQSPSGKAAVKFDCPPGFNLRSISVDSALILDTPDADSRN